MQAITNSASRAAAIGARYRLPLAIALLILTTFAYWSAVGLLTSKTPNYMGREAETVYELGPFEIMSPLWISSPKQEWPSYYIFSPLGFNITALADKYLLALLVLGADYEPLELRGAKRLLFLHAAMIGLAAAAGMLLLLRVYGATAGVIAAAIFLALNDGFYHSLSFVATMGLYPQLLGAILAAAGLACVLANGPERRPHMMIASGLLIATLAHAQSGALPFALIAASVAAWLIWKVPFGDWRLGGLILPLGALALFLAMRLGMGLDETGRVTESQYVFSYPSVLLMVEEMIVNATHHVANAVDSLVVPWPMQSVSILKNYDMNEFNKYNQLYSKYPNMQYRLMAMWYAGLLFGLALWFSAAALRTIRASARDVKSSLALVGLALLWMGFLLHVPVMHRDYFEIPGYNVGYKSTISVLGVALLLPFAWGAWIEPLLALQSRFIRGSVAAGLCCWVMLCAIGKIVLHPPYGYPW